MERLGIPPGDPPRGPAVDPHDKSHEGPPEGPPEGTPRYPPEGTPRYPRGHTIQEQARVDVIEEDPRRVPNKVPTYEPTRAFGMYRTYLSSEELTSVISNLLRTDPDASAKPRSYKLTAAVRRRTSTADLLLMCVSERHDQLNINESSDTTCCSACVAGLLFCDSTIPTPRYTVAPVESCVSASPPHAFGNIVGTEVPPS